MAGAPRPPRRGARLLHPHERRGPQALRPGVPPADPRQRPRRRLPGRLRGPLLRRLRGLQDGGGARRRQVPRARHRARVDRGAQLVLPAVGVPGAAARALRRAAGLRPPGVPGERGADVRRGRAPGLLDQPCRPALGHPDPVGPRAGRLRVGGRARQLPERADVCATRRESRRPLLAGRASPAGKGHPPLPLRLLARDAARRGLRAAPAALRARIPALGTTERSRSRSATSPRTRSTSWTSTGRTRSGSGALAPSPSGRTASRRSKACASATSASSGTTWGTSSRASRR